MKKNKRSKNRKNTRVRGISFPIAPVDVLALAQEQALQRNRNVSNHIADLILQFDQKKEENGNG